MSAKRRVFLIVCDSLGVGALPDAAAFGDEGAHTLDHLARAVTSLSVPRLLGLGLGNVPGVSALPNAERPEACFGRCAELSPGKDTTTGHWEMAGCVLTERFPTFPAGFPSSFIDELVRRAELTGVLCNLPASGTEAIEHYAGEHIATNRPIVYTSADSVFQIAAHEYYFGLERLYEVCRIARELLDPLGVARVIARPFVGKPGAFRRTYRRRDFSLVPPRPTVLDALAAAGVPVIGVGKIADIFAGRGVTETHHSEGNRDGMRIVADLAAHCARGLVFTNLVDFDMLYGHRRDPAGYARALEEFDEDLRRLDPLLRPEDVLVLTADHGNDPTRTGGTDHTREYVPLLVWGPRVMRGVPLGTRASLADVGATVAELFQLGAPAGVEGRSFAPELFGTRRETAASTT